MKNSITKLKIRNFKSLKNVEFKPSRVNIFIGKPNSGKSNLLEAISLHQLDMSGVDNINESKLFRANTGSQLFYDNDTTQPIEIISNKFLYHVRSGNLGTHLIFYSWNSTPPPAIWNKISKFYETDPVWRINSFNNQQKLSLQITQLSIEQDGKFTHTDHTRQFHFPLFKYDFSSLSKYQKDPYNKRLHPNGSNLYEIVKSNSILKRWLVNVFAEYDLELILDTVSRQFEIHKKQDGFSYKIPFENTPDTVRRMLFHMAAIESNKNSVILFEEPESHSFPPYISELATTIADDKDNQYFIATHSPYLLNQFISKLPKATELAIFYTYWEDYQTKIRKLTQKEIDDFYSKGYDFFFNLDLFHKK